MSKKCISTLNRLHEAIAKPIRVQGESFSLTVSIGVSIYPQDDNDPDVLLRHADQSMYLAKQLGKNRYQLYDPEQDQKSRDYFESMQRLRQGLENQEFELYYQPKIDLISQNIVGAEALIRWNHPERGILLPGNFLEDIRNLELEIKLGEWVIDTALNQLLSWRAEGLEIAICINIAASHLLSKNFVEYLQHLLIAKESLSFDQLHVEILETAALEDFQAASTTIERCKKLGVQFALDDFGTGYSSLTYLHRLPVDTLKIDQSFVRNMLVNKGDHAIVQGVIALAEAFDLNAVAEGIESMEHLHALLAMGCQFGQGFGIARPCLPRNFGNGVRQ